MTPITWVLLIAAAVLLVAMAVGRVISTMNPSGPLLDTEKEGSQ